MKKFLLAAVFYFILILSAKSQAPDGINYQAIARDALGAELINKTISIRAGLLFSSPVGTLIYEETHTISTNQFGLFTIILGQGASTGNGSVSSPSNINWGTGAHFLKIEMDPDGGTNYLFIGTSQLLSVPYALFAKMAGNGPAGATGPTGPQGLPGATGPQGAAGADSNIPGPIGPTGLQGAQGSQGPTGAASTVPGPTGTGGPQGITGPQGPTGAVSIVPGPTGPAGPQGTTGANSTVPGPTGSTGPIGPQGIQGVTGADSNVQGPTGPQGIQGSTGPQGIQGIAGAQGIQGITGPTGGIGPTGVQGTQGPTGSIGPTGADGLAGTQGIQGITGATGPTGPQGIQGITGLQGSFTPVGSLGQTVFYNGIAWDSTGNLFNNKLRIGINNTNPDLSSALDISSTSSGILIPRMTQLQRTSIVSPAEGLLVYQTNLISGFYYYTGGTWVRLRSTVDASSSEWSLTGNAGTNPTNNFIGTTDSVDLVLRTNNQPRLRIAGSGNVGIGTSLPSAKLHISGNTIPSAAIDLENTASAQKYRFTTDGGGNFNIMDLTAGGFNRVTINPAGNIGINNTSPTSRLDVTGKIKTDSLQITGSSPAVGMVLTANDAIGNASWQTLPSGSNMWSRTAPNVFLTNPSDSVGIGTANPLAKFHLVKTGGFDPAMMIISNASFPGEAISVTNSGGGRAGMFQISSSANTTEALFVTTLGSGGGIRATTSNNLGPAIKGLTTGNSNNAGYFEINNPASSYQALFATSNGAGDAASFINSGTGHSATFLSPNTSNDSDAVIILAQGNGAALLGVNQGLGSAGVFAIDNPVSAGNGLLGSTNGSGKAVFGLQSGTGYAGAFWINNTANDSAAVIALTGGNGQAVYGLNTGTGNAGLFQISNNASSANALFANTNGSGTSVFGYNNGTGSAAIFQIDNASNPESALVAITNGLGKAATFQGKINITDGTEGAGKILTSDATGNASWQMPSSSSGWSLTGNSGTTPGANFIGTNDSVNFQIKTNAIQRMNFGSAPNTEVWIGSPASGLNVFSVATTNSTYRAITAENNNNTSTSDVIYGQSSGSGGAAIHGNAASSSGSTFGVMGRSYSSAGTGVAGLAMDAVGINNVGVYGYSASPSGFAGFFEGKTKTLGKFITDSIQIMWSSAAIGKVLTAIDATGNAEWQTPSNSSGWINSSPYVFLKNISDSVGIGTSAPNAKLHVKSASNNTPVIIQANTAQSNTNPILKFQKSDGTDLLWLNSDDQTNVFLGYEAGKINDFGSGGYANTFIGYGVGSGNTNGPENTAVGFGALNLNNGQDNTAMGVIALSSNTSGIYNSVFGAGALSNNTSGSFNTVFGTESGMNNLTGSGNIFLGYRAGSNETGSNKLYIANNDTTAPLIYGDFSSGKIGVGTNNPLYSLQIEKPTSLDPQVMLNTTAGSFNIGYKIKTAGGEWLLGKENGEFDMFKIKYSNGLNSFTGFSMISSGNPPKIGIGTGNPLNFFHVQADLDGTMDSSLIMTNAGNVGIGIANPGGKLHILGKIRLGSETGTSDPPAQVSGYSGLVIRRINSSDSTLNQVVAVLSDGITLERDGTMGGMLIRRTGASSQAKILAIIYPDGGVPTNSYIAASGAGTNGLSSSTSIKYIISCLSNGHYTEVSMMRISTTDGTWIGTVASTVDQ